MNGGYIKIDTKWYSEFLNMFLSATAEKNIPGSFAYFDEIFNSKKLAIFSGKFTGDLSGEVYADSHLTVFNSPLGTGYSINLTLFILNNIVNVTIEPGDKVSLIKFEFGG